MRTTRAVVIDDDPNEAMCLLKALSRLGIGSAYFAGDNNDELPDTPIEGVRIVFLDLFLFGIRETRHAIPTTVNVLIKCVKFHPRVTGIICWTAAHKDEITFLHEELERKGVVPAFLLALDNKLDFVEAGSKGIVQLESQVTSRLKEAPGHYALIKWEEASHNAASACTHDLVKLSANDNELIEILGAVAKAAADESLQADSDTVQAMCRGLGSLHTDAIESSGVEALWPIKETIHSGTLEKRSLSAEQKARLNKVLLTTTSDRLRPGNVYLAESGFAKEDELQSSKRDLAATFLPSQSDKHRRQIDAVVKCSRLVELEITPACDHAQSKRADARLIRGLLVYGGEGLKVEDLHLSQGARVFAKEIEPIELLLPGCSVPVVAKLFLNARHLKTQPVEQMEKQNPMFRFRPTVVADVQAWFASHAARPGYVSIR